MDISLMQFSSATEDDKAYFRALNRACYEDVIGRQFGPWDDEHQNRSFEAKWPENNFRKIRIGDELVGGVWIDDGPEFVQLREIQIHPKFQGQGIGTRVVTMEIDNARAQGKSLRLRVLHENVAYGLYLRLGFVVIDRNEHQYVMECA